jgi:hypothetical protein
LKKIEENNITETERNITETERNITETHRVRPQKNENKLYECPDCNKTFKQEHGYYRHRKHRCIGEENNQCEYCGKEYKKLKFLEKHELKCRKRPQIFNQTNITNNNTTINNNDNRQINNTFNIHIYGQEDINKMITDDVYEKLMLKNPEKALSILMKHFYIDIPEHRNVLYTNPSHTHCKIYNGEKWIMTDISNVLKDRLLFINKNVMKGMNKRELMMIDSGVTGFVNDEKEIKIDNTISDMLMSIGATKEELEVYKKSQTYKDDLAYVNEQRKYRNEIKNVKKDHCYDLINHKDEILEKMK